MMPVREGTMHGLDEKHELHIVGSNITNVIHLTDAELAALRATVSTYRETSEQ